VKDTRSGDPGDEHRQAEIDEDVRVLPDALGRERAHHGSERESD
jgi:hypothetical protein